MVSRLKNYFERRREENADADYYRCAAKIYEGRPDMLADAVGARQRRNAVLDSTLASYRGDIVSYEVEKAITGAQRKQKARQYDSTKHNYNK